VKHAACCQSFFFSDSAFQHFDKEDSELTSRDLFRNRLLLANRVTALPREIECSREQSNARASSRVVSS
jgi:hypothetical protein